MEPYTLDRGFARQSVIDGFDSLIWTERYYGDGEVVLEVPATAEMIAKITMGTFLSIKESEEVMILETVSIEKGVLKASGISLLKWLNNRFIRTSANHEDRYWYLSGASAGWVMWQIVYNMCCAGSPYLDGTNPTGITNPARLVIPNLVLQSYDTTGGAVTIGVPYGPVYDSLREIATTYEIGQQIVLDWADSDGYSISYRNYKGIDRTSLQTTYPVVRFSPSLDSFADIKELQSIATQKTLAFAFAPSNPDGLATVPGESSLSDIDNTGFDLRAEQVFAEDITTDMVGGDPTNLVKVLNTRAFDAITKNHLVQMVDGEIVPDNQYLYGKSYNLGDLIEIEGNSGVVKVARVTEYIRAQDSAGEKAYPTVTVVDQ